MLPAVCVTDAELETNHVIIHGFKDIISNKCFISWVR